MNPRVLADLGDEGIDQRPSGGFRINRRKMGLGQELANDLCRVAGVHQVVDDQGRLAITVDALEDGNFALRLVIVGRDTHGVDEAHLQFACDDRSGNEAAAGDGDDLLPRALLGESPGERFGVAVELFPGDGKIMLWADHGDTVADFG